MFIYERKIPCFRMHSNFAIYSTNALSFALFSISFIQFDLGSPAIENSNGLLTLIFRTSLINLVYFQAPYNFRS